LRDEDRGAIDVDALDDAHLVGWAEGLEQCQQPLGVG
jgi:hypothetical protein